MKKLKNWLKLESEKTKQPKRENKNNPPRQWQDHTN